MEIKITEIPDGKELKDYPPDTVFILDEPQETPQEEPLQSQ